jgi:hypothetical protein
MKQVIIYNHDNDTPILVVPSPEALAQYGIYAIALKDVPAGKRFKIVNVDDLPDAPQEIWEIDDIDLTDGVGAESNEFLGVTE